MSPPSEQELYNQLVRWINKHNISNEALKDFEAILDKLKGKDDESK